ncbi:MAG: glycoside hydrolase family 99-like domain-containing protein [Tabrizicola sp.]|jgi:lipopolysaccharide biosynthesis protein|nr:glycoside hydrolase family 99-like domain-containing protein [Tabrizicola sp.]
MSLVHSLTAELIRNARSPWRVVLAHYKLRVRKAVARWNILKPARQQRLLDKIARTDPARYQTLARHAEAVDAVKVADPIRDEAAFRPYDPALSVPTPNVKAIAFYLPQFHPFPENDAWWGKGFTEWTNVGKARPLFPGHYQPHCPIHLGYYDLRLPEVMVEQARIARQYAVSGFAYHFYWFAGRTLMEQPLRTMLGNPDVDIPFFLSWANENWTRRWDGMENEVLIAQSYTPEDARAMLRHVADYMRDPRYIRVDGRPVFSVYRPAQIPDPARMVDIWRDEARRQGLGELHLIGIQTTPSQDHRSVGFDVNLEFAPHGIVQTDLSASYGLRDGRFAGAVHDYNEAVTLALAQPDFGFPRYRSLMLGWDNTARVPGRASIQVGFTAEAYQRWLTELCRRARSESWRKPDERFVFINAWNEWAEGTHLEPDQRLGFAYLEATRRAILAG